jgi:hypothetical protein
MQGVDKIRANLERLKRKAGFPEHAGKKQRRERFTGPRRRGCQHELDDGGLDHL